MNIFKKKKARDAEAPQKKKEGKEKERQRKARPKEQCIYYQRKLLFTIICVRTSRA